MIIVVSFIISSIPNQVVYESEMEANKSVIIEEETAMSGSRSESYDLGIDSIEIRADSDYWMGCSSECIVVESLVPKDFVVKVTNYGAESVDEVVINLMIKSTADGLVQYDNTFSSEAFSAGHPMHISDSLETGDSIIFTFNKTNDWHQLIFDGENEYYARHPMFLISGLSYIQATIIVEDDDANNNRFREDVEVAKWIENGEHYDDEVGPSIWFGDTDDNGADSLDHINMHRSTDFDHDADGCGWARDCTDEEGTDNISSALGCNSALGTFNQYGWFKDGANPSECDWDVFDDINCPKFTSEPSQDDFFLSPPMDLSAMENMFIGFAYRGNLQEGGFECNNGDFIPFDFANDGSEDCDDGSDEPGNGYDFECYNGDNTISMEWVNDGYEDCEDGSDEGYIQTGDVVRLQASKDGWSWTNLWALTSYDNSWDWETFVLDEGVVEELAYFYGSDDTDSVYLRFQADSDGDDTTECNGSPCSVFFIDNIVLGGSEKVTRDVAVGDISVREGDDMIVKDSEGNSLWREINATVINAGEQAWSDLPVKFSVTNSQGDDMSGYLDSDYLNIYNLEGDGKYGDIRPGIGDEDQKDLFVLFQASVADAYYVMVEVLVPAGKDFFPSNNSMTVKLCIFSDGDDDDDDCVGNNQDECHYTPDGEEVDEYGCSYSQRDTDSDGITNDVDNCIGTPDGEEVDEYGCSASQRDTDDDGIIDDMDYCPDTPDDEEVDAYGCSVSQQDTDGDGITDVMDDCPETPDDEFAGSEDPVDEYGCSDAQKFTNWYVETDWYLEGKSSACSGTDNNSAELCGNMFAEFCGLEESKEHSVCVLSDEICDDNDEENLMMSSAELDIWFCHGFNGDEDVEEKEDTDTENFDSGPEVESLEEEPEIPSLGLVAVIFSVFAIAFIRRN